MSAAPLVAATGAGVTSVMFDDIGGIEDDGQGGKRRGEGRQEGWDEVCVCVNVERRGEVADTHPGRWLGFEKHTHTRESEGEVLSLELIGTGVGRVTVA